MAATKKQTATERSNLRNELGLNAEPVAIDVVKPLSPAATGASNMDVNHAVTEQEAVERPSHWEILKASIQNDNSISDLLSETPQFPIDLEFDGAAYWKDSSARMGAMPGIDRDEVMEDVAGASSAEEAEHWLKSHESDYANEQVLIDAGMKGMLTRMAVSILDPVDITVSAATGGAAGALLKGKKFGKIITAAVTAGAATGATEAYLASNNASRDETDVLFATLAGIGLGGGIGALISRAEAKKLASISDDIASDNLDSALNKLEGGGDSAGARRRASESMVPDKKLAGSAYDNVRQALEDTDEIEFSFKGLNQMFQTMQSKIFFSPSQIVRKISSRMLEGGLLKNKGVRSRTAEGTASLLRKTFEAGVFRESLPQFRQWAKNNGIGSFRRNLGAGPGEQFYSEVGRAMRGEIGDDISKEAVSAAQNLRKYMDNIHQLAQDAGVKGFDSKALDDYFPRMLNRGKFDQVRTRYGNDALGDWFSRSIVNANEDITPELADKLGRAYVHTMNRKIAGIENDLLHGVRLDDVEKLREMFEGYDGLDELLGELENLKTLENTGRGTVSFGKRRMQFDESTSAPIKAADGTEEMLNFHQMFENDARKVLKRYSHAMSGHIGMARELGIKSRADFEQIEKAIIDEANLQGSTRSLDDAHSEIATMREAYDLLIGRNTIDSNPTGDLSKMSRMWTRYTYSTRGGSFGVNALGEFGRVIGAAGVRSFIRSMPEWASLMRRGVDGEIEHGLAREIELMFAPGINGMTGVAIKNMDEFGERLDGTSAMSRFAQKVDGPLSVAGRATATGSGLNLLTDLPQRLAGVEMIRKFARFANGKKISAGQAARIRNMGIDDAMLERIFKQFREAGVYKNGRLVDLDHSKWLDDEALDALNFGMNREVRSIIQENDISTVTKYFHHPVGRVVLQFLRFPMEAVNKQLAHSIHFADAEAIKGTVSALFITSTAYIAQTSIDFANNPEERKKRLTPENIAKVAFMRTGVSSMIPTATDMIFPHIGGKLLAEAGVEGINPDGKLFSYGRSSGFATGFLGNPVLSTADTMGRLGGNLVHAAQSSEHQVAAQDIRDGAKLLPGYRTLGFSNAINAVAEQFPESRKE